MTEIYKKKNMSSFKAYEKVDEADQAKLVARRKTQKRLTIIGLCSIILVGVVVVAVVGTRRGNPGANIGGADQPIATSMKAVCNVTFYPETCYSSLGSLANSTQIEPVVVFKLAIQSAMTEVSNAAKRLSEPGVLGGATADNMTAIALENCQELLSLAMDHLNNTLLAGSVSLLQVMDDLKTWLSSSGTYQETCIDGFENANGTTTLKTTIANHLKNSTETTSNGLAITTWISKVLGSLKLRRLMSFSDEHHEEPKWLHSEDRKLLQNPDLRTMATIVVAKDGSSTYNTITAALQAVPDTSDQRFVIYVKRGVYNENVEVGKNKWNVVMVGDGMTSTVVTGRLNYDDGTPTFKSATFAVYGQGFVAQDMGFQNTAGPGKHQAVALMSNSDKSIFYRCNVDGYQDTLYAHANRQFYRECNIYGTVDFIFGNSAVVLQNCNIFPKRPLPDQKNTITAQGKTDSNQNTGISIHGCTISPYENLTSVKTYLGRPWKDFSTTVILCSNLGSLIDPTGWLPWVGTSAPSTIFYAEYGNYGPGSFTNYRVKWTGLKTIDSNTAGSFTVGSFINGNTWIPASGVPFKLGL